MATAAAARMTMDTTNFLTVKSSSKTVLPVREHQKSHDGD